MTKSETKALVRYIVGHPGKEAVVLSLVRQGNRR